MNNLKVYILTSDKTCDNILELSLYNWKKYWENDIVVLGFNKGENICEKFNNVSFYSLGKTQNINEYTHYVYSFFKTYCKEPTAILSLDDFFPLKPINYKELIKINNKIKSDERFVKACLSPGFYQRPEDLMIDGFRCVRNAPYFYTMQVSLLDTSYLQQIFVEKLSPWELELKQKTDDKLCIKTTNIPCNIFEIDYIDNFTCECIIRTNTSSHLSSPYTWISLLGLELSEIYSIKNKYDIKEDLITFGHNKGGWFMCNLNDIKNDNNLIKEKWREIKDTRVKKEYYYLYNDIYKFKSLK